VQDNVCITGNRLEFHAFWALESDEENFASHPGGLACDYFAPTAAKKYKLATTLLGKFPIARCVRSHFACLCHLRLRLGRVKRPPRPHRSPLRPPAYRRPVRERQAGIPQHGEWHRVQVSRLPRRLPQATRQRFPLRLQRRLTFLQSRLSRR
jgi:hypothetical protein